MFVTVFCPKRGVTPGTIKTDIVHPKIAITFDHSRLGLENK